MFATDFELLLESIKQMADLVDQQYKFFYMQGKLELTECEYMRSELQALLDFIPGIDKVELILVFRTDMCVLLVRGTADQIKKISAVIEKDDNLRSKIVSP